MAEVPRVAAETARRKLQNQEALLVCAYDDETKCNQIRLEGALTLGELRQRLTSLPKEQEIILYCA